MPLIEFDHVTKTFPHAAGRVLLRTHLLRWFSSEKHTLFYALKNVSFTMQRGECLGIVGRNGAGKSTLLSMVAGLAKPNGGHVSVNGRVGALLELGSGFHPDLSGAENLVLNASLLGIGKKRIAELFDQIVEFSGVVDFINEPLRTYSSGMTLRLAFSVAIHTEPDLLLIDEVLGVGDSAFQAKCAEALESYRRRGGSLLFVSHAAATVRKMCDRAIWLDHGELMMEGKPDDVLKEYEGTRASVATVAQPT